MLRTRSHGDKALKGKTKALETAAGLGDVPLLQMLVAAGASLDSDALLRAFQFNRKDAVRYLLGVGAIVNRLDKHGRAPFEIGIRTGCFEIVQILIDAKANVNVCSNGGTALHAALWPPSEFDCRLQLASAQDILAIVQLLLKAGADVNNDSPSCTALQLASEQGRLEVVQVLVKAGADVNAGGLRGTALQLASGKGELAIVQFLLEAGVEVRVGPQYSLALWIALRLDRGKVVKALLEATAQLVGFDYYRACRNALEIASRYGRKAVVEVVSDAVIKFLLARMASGYLPVATGQELLMNVCDVDEYVLRLATQQEYLDQVNSIIAIKSLKDALTYGSNEALTKSIEVILPSPAHQKDDVKLLIDHCRLQELVWLINSPNSCVARYKARVHRNSGAFIEKWRTLTIRGPDVLLRAS